MSALRRDQASARLPRLGGRAPSQHRHPGRHGLDSRVWKSARHPLGVARLPFFERAGQGRGGKRLWGRDGDGGKRRLFRKGGQRGFFSEHGLLGHVLAPFLLRLAACTRGGGRWRAGGTTRQSEHADPRPAPPPGAARSHAAQPNFFTLRAVARALSTSIFAATAAAIPTATAATAAITPA